MKSKNELFQDGYHEIIAPYVASYEGTTLLKWDPSTNMYEVPKELQLHLPNNVKEEIWQLWLSLR